MRGGRNFPGGAAAVLAAIVFAGRLDGQSTSTPLGANVAPAPEPTVSPPPAAAPAPISASTAAQMSAALTRLTQSNQELLDLLKKQQAVLEDIQYDRRLQNRQISSLEERLQEALQENAQLQAKVAKLEEQISLGPAAAASPPERGDTGKPRAADSKTASTPAPEPAPPESYLPPQESEGMPGTKSWHRLFTLSGADSRDSDYFHIQGRQWRVLWHNQDRPGASYVNTSALFISAFPKGDTIPQKVCSKLGSGGDGTELTGPGDFYLKVEASGGSWELAVEDFK